MELTKQHVSGACKSIPGNHSTDLVGSHSCTEMYGFKGLYGSSDEDCGSNMSGGLNSLSHTRGVRVQNVDTEAVSFSGSN